MLRGLKLEMYFKGMGVELTPGFPRYWEHQYSAPQVGAQLRNLKQCMSGERNRHLRQSGFCEYKK